MLEELKNETALELLNRVFSIAHNFPLETIDGKELSISDIVPSSRKFLRGKEGRHIRNYLLPLALLTTQIDKMNKQQCIAVVHMCLLVTGLFYAKGAFDAISRLYHLNLERLSDAEDDQVSKETLASEATVEQYGVHQLDDVWEFLEDTNLEDPQEAVVALIREIIGGF